MFSVVQYVVLLRYGTYLLYNLFFEHVGSNLLKMRLVAQPQGIKIRDVEHVEVDSVCWSPW